MNDREYLSEEEIKRLVDIRDLGPGVTEEEYEEWFWAVDLLFDIENPGLMKAME